jgi:hypothetical protein
LFLFRLAAQLGMTVAQLCDTMDSRELSEWMAVHRFFMPLADSWHQTGIMAAAMLAPYSGKSKPPKPQDFVPIESPPQHELQTQQALEEFSRQLRGE